MQQLEDRGVPIDMQWEIYPLYESILGRVLASIGLSEVLGYTIGVKQGCPLSGTLVTLVIDMISN